jgi:hypothetical protein
MTLDTCSYVLPGLQEFAAFRFDQASATAAENVETVSTS